MTDAEWQTTTNPWAMLNLLKGKASDRQLRLFAGSVCTQVASRVRSDCSGAVAVAERYAGGLGNDCDLLIATAWIADAINSTGDPGERATEMIGHIGVLGEDPGVSSVVELADRFDGARLLRDIFGNPFRPAAVEPAWLTPTVVALAEGIYAHRAFDRMPILADALQDAGCENADVLDHCRSNGMHVRGCWLVDLLLGKV